MAITAGSKYSQTQDLDIAQVAKLVRADLKAAQKDGVLPVDLRFSVTIDRYSMGQSIDVRVKGFAGDRRSREGQALEATVEKILHAYNRRGVDSMSDHYDVKFSGVVSFERAA